MFRDVNLLALIVDVLETTLALPTISRVFEVRVFRDMNLLAPIVDAAEPPFALPASSEPPQEGVFGDLNLHTPVTVAPEAPVALPAVSEVDVGMVRDGRGVLRPRDGREQPEPGGKQKSCPGSRSF